jgi:hypothetical protein
MAEWRGKCIVSNDIQIVIKIQTMMWFLWARGLATFISICEEKRAVPIQPQTPGSKALHNEDGEQVFDINVYSRQGYFFGIFLHGSSMIAWFSSAVTGIFQHFLIIIKV